MASQISHLVNYACKFMLISLLLAIMPQAAWADPTNKDHAQMAVSGWLKVHAQALNSKMHQNISGVESHKDHFGQTLFHVVNLEPEGFVVVSPDDLIEPVIAFSATGHFEANTENCLYDVLLKDMSGRLAEVSLKEASKTQERAQRQDKWNKLRTAGNPDALVTSNAINTSLLTGLNDVRVDPILSSTWGQDTVGGLKTYNYYTPYQYVCGCVATAMAQLMRFHNHPTSGIGVRSFTCTIDGNGRTLNTRGGDGLGGAYNYSQMPLNPDALSITDAQRAMIGSLCYDAGVATHMQYTANSSGAYPWDAMNALLNVFGYSNARYGQTENNPIVYFNNFMANPNLDAGLPVLVGITGSNVSHEIVCDGYGYDGNILYHHLNMGWSGGWNAWYNLPSFTAGYSFTGVTSCIYNIFPSGGGEILSGRVVDSTGLPMLGVTITAGNYTGTTNKYGVYALVHIPYGTYTVTASKMGYTFASQSATVSSSVNTSYRSGNVWGLNFQGALIPEAPIVSALSVYRGSKKIYQNGEFSYISVHTLLATASDNVGVTRVDFYLGGRLVGTDNSSPYQLSLGSSYAGVGPLVVKAIAYDSNGNSGERSITYTF